MATPSVPPSNGGDSPYPKTLEKIVLTATEWDEISTCTEALHSILHKTPQLDPMERDDLIAITCRVLGSCVAKIGERLSEIAYGKGGDDDPQ